MHKNSIKINLLICGFVIELNFQKVKHYLPRELLIRDINKYYSGYFLNESRNIKKDFYIDFSDITYKDLSFKKQGNII